MARTGGLHWVGALFLLVAAILLLVATITAPVVNRLSLLRVELNDNQGTAISFGTFGYCMLGGGNSGDYCSARNVGYHPSDVVSAAENSGFGSTAASAANGLTGAMVLHPVACVLTFIAFLVAMGAGVIGSLASFLISVLAFILTLVVMAIDFTLFGIIRNHVNSDGTTATAHYDSGMWCVLAAFILLFIGALVVLFTCCSARMRKRHDRRAGDRAVTAHEKSDYGAPRRSRWGRFGRR